MEEEEWYVEIGQIFFSDFPEIKNSFANGAGVRNAQEKGRAKLKSRVLRRMRSFRLRLFPFFPSYFFRDLCKVRFR